MRRIVTFMVDGAPRAGVELDGLVVDLAETAVGNGAPVSVRALLEQGGAGALDAAIAAALAAVSSGAGKQRSVADVELTAPICDPDKIICVGANYRDHLEESDYPAPPYPEVFAKYPNALIGGGQAIPLTDVSQQVDFEGELALVIGKRCKDVSRDDALAYIGGYCAVNDLSARDVQLRVNQWVVGKTFDGFAPLGPGLVPASAIANPGNLEVESRLNGTVMQHSNTAHMIFDIPHIIEYLSSMITLVPGDVICTGTPGGVGYVRTPPVFLRDGDVFEVEVEGIGVLSNPVREMSRIAAGANAR